MSSSSPSSHRRHGGTAAPEESPQAAEARNWASLPWDIVLAIFLRLGPCEVMLGAELACKPWRRVALEETMLWRRVGMENPTDNGNASVEMAMKLVAVGRAAGQCQAFQGYCDDGYLLDLVKRAPSLKYLCIEHYSDCRSGENLIKALMKLTLLEEIEIHFKCTFDKWGDNMLQSLCQACPRLKKLVLRYAFAADLFDCVEDEFLKEAIDREIPMMLKLHTLELYECGLTGKGLKAILDSCPLLETLHIGGHFKREMDKDLRKKCARVKNITLPTKIWYPDSFDDCDMS